MMKGSDSHADQPSAPSGDRILDQFFPEARAKLIDLAAILDRIDRYGGAEDYRLRAFHRAMEEVSRPGGADRARRVLECFSDPTTKPADKPVTPVATGAWAGERKR